MSLLGAASLPSPAFSVHAGRGLDQGLIVAEEPQRDGSLHLPANGLEATVDVKDARSLPVLGPQPDDEERGKVTPTAAA